MSLPRQLCAIEAHLAFDRPTFPHGSHEAATLDGPPQAPVTFAAQRAQGHPLE
jgi:hypothetical protein